MSSKKILLAGAAAVLCLGLPATALGHDTEAKGDKKEIRRVIVVKDGDGEARADRRIEGLRRDREIAIAECKGERSEIDERSDKERTRIVVCTDSLSSADRAKRLEETLGRIRTDEHLSAEHKAKVEIALEQAIARLRAAK